MATDEGDWWRPRPGSKAEQRLNFLGAAVSITATSFALAGITWSLASTDDGRIKALLWWCFGVTGLVAYVLYQVKAREHRDVRFARALECTHKAHHILRDAAYERYILGCAEDVWSRSVQVSLQQFSQAFSVACGAACHATIKMVYDPVSGGEGRTSPSELVVQDFARSEPRSFTMRSGVPANTVGRNSDFEHLFSRDSDNRSWSCNDLLALQPGTYKNPHWPEDPSKRTVPYRSTMVWPIRKVLQVADGSRPQDMYVYGFLTIDCRHPGLLDEVQHFDLGAAYADHLVSVLWNPKQLGTLAAKLGQAQPSPEGAHLSGDTEAAASGVDTDGGDGAAPVPQPSGEAADG